MIGTAILVLQIMPMGGMDLPVQPVSLAPGTKTMQWGLSPDDDGDDPRDTPPPVFYGEEIDCETDTIFYVIDKSGSMLEGHQLINGTWTIIGSRMERARAELLRSVNGLAASIKFNVIAYNDHTALFSNHMLEATPANKALLAQWKPIQDASGMTATGPAVAQALLDRRNQTIVLLTDGEPNYGVQIPMTSGRDLDWWNAMAEGHRSLIRRSNRQRATVNVFGMQVRGIARTFCQGVASDSGGLYTDVF